jgi:hypothetical protein
MKLTSSQQTVLNYINAKGGELYTSDKNVNKTTVNSLIKKGLIVEESRSRLREDDREMIYWRIYRIVTPLEQALKE